MSTTDITLAGGVTTLVSLTTTGILATYSNSTSLYCTSGEQTFYITAVKNATIAAVTFKCQASPDDSTFADIQSTRQDTGASAVEHTFTLSAGTNRLIVTCASAKRSASMRISIKADAQGGTGESITITGKAW